MKIIQSTNVVQISWNIKRDGRRTKPVVSFKLWLRRVSRTLPCTHWHRETLQEMTIRQNAANSTGNNFFPITSRQNRAHLVSQQTDKPPEETKKKKTGECTQASRPPRTSTTQGYLTCPYLFHKMKRRRKKSIRKNISRTPAKIFHGQRRCRSGHVGSRNPGLFPPEYCSKWLKNEHR